MMKKFGLIFENVLDIMIFTYSVMNKATLDQIYSSDIMKGFSTRGLWDILKLFGRLFWYYTNNFFN